MEEELVWKSLNSINFPRYEVSNTGLVRNKKSKYLLKIFEDSEGYNRVCLQVGKSEKKGKQCVVHRLVAYGHIEQTNPDAQTVDHIDRNKSNNNVENLRWATRKEQANNRTQLKKGCNARVIIQKDVDGNIVNTFKTTTEASKILRMRSKTIKSYASTNTGREGYTLHFIEDRKEDNEIWKELQTPDGVIHISNRGRRKMENGRLTYGVKLLGYLKTKIRNGNYLMHRLVAQAFCEGFEEDKVVNHKDSNKENNKYENLEWCTMQENIQHASEFGKLNKYRQKIARCDDDMNTLEEYPSVAHVARLYKIKYDGDIHKAIRNHYRFRGHYWKKIT